jgi:membrane protease YdiL (CAAX protease family)
MRPAKAPTLFPDLRPLVGPVLLITVFLFSLATFSGWVLLVQLPALFLLALVFTTKDGAGAPAALLIFFLFIGRQFFPNFVWLVPTAAFLIPLLLTWVCTCAWPSARIQWRWMKKGELDLSVWLLVLVISLVSAVALLLWAFWTDNLGFGASLLQEYKGVPRWFLFFLGVPGFAVLNAFTEESIFRGVIFEALIKKFPNQTALTLTAQASAFAAVHFVSGFPNGKLGYLMTFLYAIALGVIRLRSNGIVAPLVAHIAADLVIGFSLLLVA